MVETSANVCGARRAPERVGARASAVMSADESGELFEEAATRILTPARAPAQRRSPFNSQI